MAVGLYFDETREGGLLVWSLGAQAQATPYLGRHPLLFGNGRVSSIVLVALADAMIGYTPWL